ncbi:pyruvate dehydrogenase [acetyl-transferring]-phosphatase 1, mitochondrial-like [Ptychodera flava]|uniref:pyruvate dehydrogenase [acetyl-transferring]-phosphatase 1, mitochondrial-like n=1 Tax=Ptychodera flava TaxID=63121 RepID=UPI003969D481
MASSRLLQWKHLSYLRNSINVLSHSGRWKTARVLHLSKRTFYTSDLKCAILSPSEVSKKLRQNEMSFNLNPYEGGIVTSFDTNQLASNAPVEDRRAASKCLRTGGLLYGVFDGHAGTACAQVVSERLFEYIAVSLLPYDRLVEINDALINRRQSLQLVKWYRNPNDYLSEESLEGYRKSLFRFVTDSLKMNVEDEDIFDALELAFLRLDEDISSEAKAFLSGRSTLYQDAVDVVQSGSCSCVAYINGVDIYVANVGDSRAVLGRKTDGSTSGWVAKALSHRHNGHNQLELERIKRAHPNNESNFVIKNGRLLAELAPLRAFGDVRYKWTVSNLKAFPNWHRLVTKHYYSPPYLTASPEVIHHRVSPQDKFLIIATDGLWDVMTKEKAVQLIGDHISGKETLEPFRRKETTGKRRQTLTDINKKLKERAVGLASRPIDENVATHLIRHALGDTEHGICSVKLSESLSLPDGEARAHRDDITIYVIFFDTEIKLRKYIM